MPYFAENIEARDTAAIFDAIFEFVFNLYQKKYKTCNLSILELRAIQKSIGKNPKMSLPYHVTRTGFP